LTEWNAQDIARKASLPASADAYQITLPEDFQAPGGVEIKIDKANSAWKDAAALAHANGLTQNQFSQMAAMYASQQAKEAAAFKAAYAGEVAKLGTNASARIDAIATWWNAMAGDDGAVLGSILRMAPTAGTIQAFERLMTKFTNQGAAPFNQGGREANAPGGKIDGWEGMTYEQRRYAQDRAAGRLR
jgi:hypothetical protein